MWPLKFRAWDNGVMLDNVVISEGYPYCWWRGPYGDGMQATLRRIDGNVLQFTGLHDKNGVEIYEGDIVRIMKGDSAEVIFHEKYLAYYTKITHGRNWEHALSVWQPSDLEVIGNIYEGIRNES